MSNPFRYFKTSPEITRLAVMIYGWFSWFCQSKIA